ncbi:MAG TPA: MFS transporter [Patescibacteria group bacterium]|nr:MFS transporter [Patescibacteria group bacterium]
MKKMLGNIPAVVWILALGHVVTDLAPGALFVALPFWKAKFALSYAEVSAIVLVQNLTASISQPVFGYLSDRRRMAWLMPLGCLLTGVFMAASLLVPEYGLVLACTAASGLANAAFHPEAAKTVHRISGADNKGSCISVFSVGGYGGVALGSLFLGVLLFQDSGHVWMYSLPSFAVSGVLLLVAARLPSGGVGKADTLTALRSAVSWPLAALLGTILTRATVSSGLSTFVPLYYTAQNGGNELYVSSLLTVYLSAGVAGTLLGGTLSDRFGSKRVMLCSVLPVAGLLYFLLSATGIWIFVLLSLVSMLLSSTATSSLLFTQKMMPRNIGMASGLTLGFSIGLGTMGVMGLGRLADIWGLASVFQILMALPLIGFLLTLYVREPEKQRRCVLDH